MSQEHSVIGNRLGISKDWLSDFGFYNYRENLKESLYIRECVLRRAIRFNLKIIDLKLTKQKNAMEVHILGAHFTRGIPLIHKNFFMLKAKAFWYYNPITSETFKAAYTTNQKMRTGKPVNEIADNYWKNIYRHTTIARRFYLWAIENYLERYLSRRTNFGVSVIIYNLIDYYDQFGANVITEYIVKIIRLFPAQQKFFKNKVKTSLFYLCLGVSRKNAWLIAEVIAFESKRSKKWSVMVPLLLQIISECFYRMPIKEGWNDVGLTRCNYLRIKISGKFLPKEMRAVQTNYYFGGSGLQSKQMPLQTLNKTINYSFSEAKTYAGILGVKVWIC